MQPNYIISTLLCEIRMYKLDSEVDRSVSRTLQSTVELGAIHRVVVSIRKEISRHIDV